MWLFIESIQSHVFRLGLLGPDKLRVKTYERRSNQLVGALADLISPQDLKKMEGICVVQGPGAFTPVRTGVLLANILARLYKKPLVGIDAFMAQDMSRLAASLMDKRYCAVSYVAPQYSSEPNIIIKKNPT